MCAASGGEKSSGKEFEFLENANAEEVANLIGEAGMHREVRC